MEENAGEYRLRYLTTDDGPDLSSLVKHHKEPDYFKLGVFICSVEGD